jgi:hypothetical protein
LSVGIRHHFNDSWRKALNPFPGVAAVRSALVQETILHVFSDGLSFTVRVGKEEHVELDIIWVVVVKTDVDVSVHGVIQNAAIIRVHVP